MPPGKNERLVYECEGRRLAFLRSCRSRVRIHASLEDADILKDNRFVVSVEG